MLIWGATSGSLLELLPGALIGLRMSVPGGGSVAVSDVLEVDAILEELYRPTQVLRNVWKNRHQKGGR